MTTIALFIIFSLYGWFLFISPTSLIWTKDLPAPNSETGTASNGRTCETCGTYTIPYPLSTGQNCGDPMYMKFKCDHVVVRFNMNGRECEVTSNMDREARNFSIKVEGSNYCDVNYRREQLDFPFNVTNWCPNGKDSEEIEVTWQPPPEPPCNNKLTDCIDFPHSTCTTTEGKSRCLCDPNYHWNPFNVGCIQGETSSKKNPISLLALVLMVTFASMIFVACVIIFAYVWRKKRAHKQDRESFYDSERHGKGLIGIQEKDSEGIEVPYFDFETILAATDNFSDENKLGQGGYGPVYKGRLPGGQEIAVKRLSSVSTQGIQEFKNEVVLISKLQHRNLVRLQGYCIKEDEKILIYEYMPNKSLDSFLFDPTQNVLLHWKLRFDIILGIARGLLYLHQDSRLRIIHRDLKTSNILLDEEMNPKISDFGLAKIFGGKDTEASTERVVGTYGYMAPEYALKGLFSIKSDVFSFGVVLLELISGKKTTGFYQSQQTSSLLAYAWRLWTENKLVDLMDPCLGESCNANQFIRFANVGLLCVQDEPSDRPTMSNVVIMLDSDIATLPTPKQPTFFSDRGSCTIDTSTTSAPEEGRVKRAKRKPTWTKDFIIG